MEGCTPLCYNRTIIKNGYAKPREGVQPSSFFRKTPGAGQSIGGLSFCLKKYVNLILAFNFRRFYRIYEKTPIIRRFIFMIQWDMLLNH